MTNLDMIAAQKAQAIITETMHQDKNTVENVITKALGVVQEQGIYAGMLYLLSRGDKEKQIADKVINQLVALLREESLRSFTLTEGLVVNPTPQQLLNHFATSICAKPVQTLLLVKNLFEQTLMYARYSAKARQEQNNPPEN
ncbi:MAG: hypothetical protein AB1489_30005 [Acidobacteriota bacterium]